MAISTPNSKSMCNIMKKFIPQHFSQVRASKGNLISSEQWTGVTLIWQQDRSASNEWRSNHDPSNRAPNHLNWPWLNPGSDTMLITWIFCKCIFRFVRKISFVLTAGPVLYARTCVIEKSLLAIRGKENACRLDCFLMCVLQTTFSTLHISHLEGMSLKGHEY